MQIQAAQKLLGINGSLVTVTGSPVRLGSKRSYQGTATGTGAVTATIIVEGSNDGITYETIMTFTLSDTTIAHAAAQADSNWFWTRARVTAITGTGCVAQVTVASTP